MGDKREELVCSSVLYIPAAAFCDLERQVWNLYFTLTFFFWYKCISVHLCEKFPALSMELHVLPPMKTLWFFWNGEFLQLIKLKNEVLEERWPWLQDQISIFWFVPLTFYCFIFLAKGSLLLECPVYSRPSFGSFYFIHSCAVDPKLLSSCICSGDFEF